MIRPRLRLDVDRIDGLDDAGGLNADGDVTTRDRRRRQRRLFRFLVFAGGDRHHGGRDGEERYTSELAWVSVGRRSRARGKLTRRRADWNETAPPNGGAATFVYWWYAWEAGGVDPRTGRLRNRPQGRNLTSGVRFQTSDFSRSSSCRSTVHRVHRLGRLSAPPAPARAPRLPENQDRRSHQYEGRQDQHPGVVVAEHRRLPHHARRGSPARPAWRGRRGALRDEPADRRVWRATSCGILDVDVRGEIAR